MDLWDWWIVLYPVVSDHGSSQESQLLLPILYIVLFVSCCNRNFFLRDYNYTKKKILHLHKRTNIYLPDENFYTTWEKPLFLFIIEEGVPSYIAKWYPAFPQNRIISFNTHLLLVNDPSDWIYMLIPIGNEIFKWFFIEWLFIYCIFIQIGGRKALWKNGGSIRCCLTRS